MDHLTALRRVLERALIHNGLRRGLHECAKALDKRTARLCLVAKDIDQPEFKRLVHALCDANSIPHMEIATRKELGDLVGLSKIKADGTQGKTVKTSVAVITDFGEDSEALAVLLGHLKKA